MSVLLIVRALPGSCGACDYYTANIDKDFRSFIRKDGRIEDIIDLTIEGLGRIFLTKNREQPIHPLLANMVTSWPFFSICSKKEWEDHKNKLAVSIYGGVLNNQTGKAMNVEGEGNIAIAPMMKWVKTVLETLVQKSISPSRKRVSLGEYLGKYDYRHSWGKQKFGENV